MVERRQLLTGGVLAGVTAAFSPEGAAAAQQQRDDGEQVASAINVFRESVEVGRRVSSELSSIRNQQRIFLKANQKFPDFLEIGIGIWENVYDWHVRHQQPINMTRLADGRYVMGVAFTTLILRPDQSDNYIGFGFDAR
jgi:hypothetical protein